MNHDLAIAAAAAGQEPGAELLAALAHDGESQQQQEFVKGAAVWGQGGWCY